jgi:predicted RNA-binding Zn-ribbon protein involved in translation (DUF1610 family)
MTAVGAAHALIRKHGWREAVCPNCRVHMLRGAEQPNGIWCESSVLVSRTNPLGLITYRATCLISATVSQVREDGVCDRTHLYRCESCGWEILIQ